MSIVPLKKVTLYGATSQQEQVVVGLQELGLVHLDEISPTRPDPEALGAANGNDYWAATRQALAYLKACPDQSPPTRTGEFHRAAFVRGTLEIQNRERLLADERDALAKAIRDLQPWGDFELNQDQLIGDVRLQFWITPLRGLEEITRSQTAYFEVSRDNQNAYLVLLNYDASQEFPGAPVKLDMRGRSNLQSRLASVEDKLDELHYRRVGLTRWSHRLESTLDEVDDHLARFWAKAASLPAEKVYALQGWIPVQCVDQIMRFAEENGLAITVSDPAPTDQPPTLLANPEKWSGSESLVTFYKTPGYNAWDPSIIAFISFAIFFAMIISDAGYGFVFGIITAYFWKRMGAKESGRRLRVILATIVAATIGYGVICGSYFGIQPPPESLLGHLRLLDNESQAVMMPLTILIGIIHLSLAHLMMAWSKRGQLTAWSSVGWVAVMIGAAAVGLEAVSSTDGEWLIWLGSVLMCGGLLAVFLFSSERPFWTLDVKTHALRIVDGLQGLAGISGLFGDTLSYLRLFALGLSSARLSATFNELGANAWNQAGFGVIAAIAIVLLGHTLNLMLGIMSGVVHGLRLNCIEFFKWSLPDEGYLFKAFAKKAR